MNFKNFVSTFQKYGRLKYYLKLAFIEVNDMKLGVLDRMRKA